MTETTGGRGLVDVHAHFTTKSYIDEAKASGHREPDGMPEDYWPEWTAERHVAFMDQAGIERSLLSMSSPGVYFGDTGQARRLAREVNLASADAVERFPDRFGHFVTLPLPDVEGSLAEIDFAYSQLRADGVVIMSNVGGRYLGAKELAPVLDELNRRHAVVFIHPTSCVGHDDLAAGRPRPMIEFLFDTARTVIDLVMTGALSLRPDLRVVVPHAGGVIPLLADRIEMFLAATGGGTAEDSALKQLAGMYFDLAGARTARQAQALLGLAPADHILYGSDHVWTRPQHVLSSLAALDEAFPDAASGWRDLASGWRELTSTNADRLLGGH